MATGKTILLVDDEEELVELLKLRFEMLGYDVHVAHDGEEGLEKARALNPDLMILDVMMPRLDGFQVCRLLKFNENTANIPIIMLTARSQDKDRELATQAGANDYHNKPFEFDDLVEKVKTYLPDTAGDTPAQEALDSRV